MGIPVRITRKKPESTHQSLSALLYRLPPKYFTIGNWRWVTPCALFFFVWQANTEQQPLAARPTLSAARILKEATTCSAVSVSAVSRVMKSMKDWKDTTPVPLGSTSSMMRANSTSPWTAEHQETKQERCYRPLGSILSKLWLDTFFNQIRSPRTCFLYNLNREAIKQMSYGITCLIGMENPLRPSH